MTRIVYRVPAGTPGKRCSCGAVIYFVLTPKGKHMPVNCALPGGILPAADRDGEGEPHWGDCPHRQSFIARREIERRRSPGG